MNRKEELERLHRQSLEGSGYGRPQRALRDGMPPSRRRGFRWGWALLLLLAGVGAWFAYNPAMEWLGRASSSDLTSGGGSSPGVKLAKQDAAKVTPEQIKAYLTPSDAEVQQLYGYVVNAPFVTENVQYSDRLKDIPFVYFATNDIVNAAAGRRIVEKDGKKGIAFHTVFFGGAARYARLVGLAAALQDAGHKDMLKKFVAAMPRRFCARCAEDDCVEFIAENGLAPAVADEKIRQRAVS